MYALNRLLRALSYRGNKDGNKSGSVFIFYLVNIKKKILLRSLNWKRLQ